MALTTAVWGQEAASENSNLHMAIESDHLAKEEISTFLTDLVQSDLTLVQAWIRFPNP
jgi:hypothetical protein